MIVAFLYFILLTWLIYYNGFFGLFNDPCVSKNQFSLLFFLKALAVPAFYIVYLKLYGGIENFDTGKFYHDVKIISGIAKTDVYLYLKILFGLQDDNKISYDYLMVYPTQNWDNGVMKDYLYNDNRVVIRVHSLLDFICFNSYYAHALFNCFLSFTGIYFIYKSFKLFFEGKEFVLLIALCFIPALWFYTGALLKEGLTVFVIGCTIYQLKQLTEGRVAVLSILWLLLLLFTCFLLKPYLLLYGAFCFGLFFWIEHMKWMRYKALMFVAILLAVLIGLNLLSHSVKNTSLFQAALKHQRIFSGVSKGGIFLFGNQRFIRLEYDSKLVKKVDGLKDRYTIRKNTTYLYWKEDSYHDTLHCHSNQDTSTVYALAYIISPSHSNLAQKSPNDGLAVFLISALYDSLAYPFFVNAQSGFQLVASFENLILLFCLFYSLIKLLISPQKKLLPLTCLIFALGVCLLIGITTPNSGAIFRYRSPAIIFIILAALFFLKPFKSIFFRKF